MTADHPTTRRRTRHQNRGTRAVLYLRQSTYREESVSLEQQETACRDHCTRMGYVVVEVTADPGVSASKNRLAARQGVQRAFRALDEERADVLVTWKGSRVARNRLDAEIAKERVAEAGARLESATEPNDRSASGRFATGMLAEVAAFEAAQIGENWRATHARRRAKGEPAQGGDRYGYRRTRDANNKVTGYEIDPHQAEVLRWMYERVIEGRGAAWIAAELNRRGERNRVGLVWGQHRIYPLLDSGFAAGLILHHERDNRNRKVGDPTYLPGHQPPIITDATWTRYEAARRARAGRPSRTVEARYPLTGLVRCGDCGGGMWPARAKHGGAGHVLVCGRWQSTRTVRCVTIARHRAEAAVKDWLEDLVRDVERAAAADLTVRRQLRRERRDRDDAVKRHAEVEGQLSALALQLARGLVPEAGYVVARDELLADLERAKADVEAADLATVTKPPHVNRTATGLLAEWDLLPAAEVRALLASLISRVEVHPPAKPHGRSSTVIVPVWAGSLADEHAP